MKRNFRNLFMIGAMAFVAAFTSCKEESVLPTVEATVNGNESVAAEIRSTSASFTLNTKDVNTVAYLIAEGSFTDKEFIGKLVFEGASENNRLVTVADGANTIDIYGLEGGTEYTACFAFESGDGYAVVTKQFTTPAYDRVITVLESKKDGFKFHFNVPDTMTYMYAFLPTEQYNSFRASGWADDVTFLLDGRTLTGPQTVEINSEEDWLYEGDGGFYIHPGSAYMLLMAECDAEGNLLYMENPDYQGGWGGDVWGPLAPATRAGNTVAPRVGDYSEEARVEDQFYPTGLYARQNLYAELTMVDSKVAVELIGKTERRIKVRCTAEDDVQYVVAPMEKNMFNELVSLVTEEAVASTLLEYYGYESYNGTQDFEFDENILYLEPDSTYIISVVGIYADDASVISLDTLHVTLTKSTLPAAVVEITQGTNPEGEITPDLVWFNIKAPEKNVFGAKHIANYTKEVQKMINQGYTYEDLISWYGGDLSEEDVQAINSDEGLTLCISSMEDMESTLIIGAFNEEEGMSIYTGVARSAALPALDPVNSTLFEDLKDEWTARIIQQHREELWFSDETGENWWTVDSVWIDTTYTTLSLGNNVDDSPASFGEENDAYWDVFASHFNNAIENGATEEQANEYAKEQVAAQFAQFKETAAKYDSKYKGQNYILGLGLEALHPYATPWDLFCSSDYVAYDMEEIFYAYGPKLFFQVQEGDQLVLLGDATVTYLPPVAGWNYYDVLLMGYNPIYANEGIYYTGSYPVEISEDKNTLVIKGVEADGEFFYPALGSMGYGWPDFFTKTCADIVLTRGADATRAAMPEFTAPKNVKAKSNRIKRTYLPTEMVGVKTVKMPYINVLEKVQEKFDKYNSRLNK